jgi:hypothetical protein
MAGGKGGDKRRANDLGGKPFRIYKFRTMRVDAEKASGAVWATQNDPRITPIGRFLRKYRLDELPQLVNVIKGDMNIVGPRPERPAIFQELKGVTFQNDVRGLGVWTERFQLAIFPHVTPDRLSKLAEDLTLKAAAVKAPGVSEEERIAISVGISHNLHPGPKSFESCETSMVVAAAIVQKLQDTSESQKGLVEIAVDRMRPLRLEGGIGAAERSRPEEAAGGRGAARVRGCDHRCLAEQRLERLGVAAP